MRGLFSGAMMLVLGLCILGCNQGEVPKVETVQAPVADPIAEAKAILTNYASGMPVTSEAESFADIAARVKEKDPAKGELLSKGFDQIKQNPATAQSKAKELLPKL
jgi:hypothetical protein